MAILKSLIVWVGRYVTTDRKVTNFLGYIVNKQIICLMLSCSGCMVYTLARDVHCLHFDNFFRDKIRKKNPFVDIS